MNRASAASPSGAGVSGKKEAQGARVEGEVMFERGRELSYCVHGGVLATRHFTFLATLDACLDFCQVLSPRI